jgi:ribokinase
LIVNEHEMARMLGRHDERNEDWDAVDWPAVSEEFREYGFAQAIVTLGAQGSVVLNNGEITRIAPVKIRAVDTTGCGDSFFAGILSGLAGGLTLEDSARLASYVSAYAATGMGAQASYGSAEQILELTR